MKNFIKNISAVAVFITAFSLFATVVEAQLVSNNTGGSSSLSSNNSSGTESSGGLSSNNSSGTESGSGLSSNNSSGTESSGGLTSNNSSGTEGTGGLSSNNSSGTEGTGSSNNGGSGNGSNDGGSSSRRSGGGSRSAVRPIISNVNIEAVGSNMIRVTWETSVPAISQLVYGTVSKEAVSNEVNFGYQSGSVISTIKSSEHAFAMIVVPGVTYYVRPVSVNGRSVYFGNEFAITKNATVIQTTSRPAIGNVINRGSETSIDLDLTTDTEDTDTETENTSTTTENTGNIIDSGVGSDSESWLEKIGNFFKKIWYFLIGKNN